MENTTKCTCGIEDCDPSQAPESRAGCPTCGQPFGNHCIRVHGRLQWDMDRMTDSLGWRAKVLAERKSRMDQMGWEEPSEGREICDGRGIGELR